MANIWSIQSGNWNDTNTWSDNRVPDPSNEDVAISDGHSVYVDSYDTIYVQSGYSITIDFGGQLDMNGSIYVDGGTLTVYGQLDVGYSAYLDLDNNAYLYICGSMGVQNGSTVEASSYGYVRVEAGGTMDLDGSLTVGYDSELTVYGQLDIGPSGYLTVTGSGSPGYGGSFCVGATALLNLQTGGYVDVTDYAEMAVYGGGRVELFGDLHLGTDTLWSVQTSALVNVYRDLFVSGSMYGGGQIVLMRRECGLYDASSNSLFVLDRAYGVGSNALHTM